MRECNYQNTIKDNCYSVQAIRVRSVGKRFQYIQELNWLPTNPHTVRLFDSDL